MLVEDRGEASGWSCGLKPGELCLLRLSHTSNNRMLNDVSCRHMVAVGAAATVLILTFDPFLQAVVSFNGSIASSEGTIPAYLSRSKILNAG